MHHRFLAARMLLGYFAIMLATSTYEASAQEALRVLDVGEGLAVTLQSGAKRAMVDSGNWFSGARVVRKLFEENAAPLEWVAFTHLHPDHLGGAPAVKAWLSPRKWYDNGENIAGKNLGGNIADKNIPNENIAAPHSPNDSPWLRWYNNEVRKKAGAAYRPLVRGDKLTLGALQVEVLSPPPERLGPDVNTNSLVLKVIKENRCVLIMGDAQEATEAFLLHTSKTDLHCSVVVVGHHGAKNASSKSFVDATKAETAIISTDKNNLNGYPDTSVVQRWKDAGATVYITAEQGTLTVTFENDGTIRTKAER